MTSAAAGGPVPFISRVQIENYKSIAHCDVRLGPFTVLLGLNAAGKSNFLDALRFVRDAMTGGLPRAARARGGLDEVLRRVPEPTEHSTIALECRIPSPDPGDGPWQARYEITVTRSTSEHTMDVHVRREKCEIGPAHGTPRDWFVVTDMNVEDSAGKPRGRLVRGGPYLGIVSRADHAG